MPMTAEELRIEVADGTEVSGVLDGKSGGPVLALAHGAGGNMRGSLLEGFARGAAGAGVACLRFNFPYSERGKKAPDREPLLRQAWAAAFRRAEQVGSPVWLAGKSLGGRIASMMAAEGELRAAGLVFVGYPLHPPGKPERIRDQHLDDIDVPVLFLQGTADPFAGWDLITGVVDRLGATLHPVEGGDHSFRVRGTRRDDEGMGSSLGEIAARFVLDRVG